MYYGFDIGGTKIEFGAFDKELNRVATQRVTTPANNYAQLIDTIVELITFYDREFSVCGRIGLGIPGIENAITGEVTTVNIPAANGKKLASDLNAKLNRPVRIENDANCFALSEAIDIKERHSPSVLGLILGTGFGAGIILNNQVYKGRNNLAGEFGHMRLPLDAWNLLGDNAPSFPCGCGKCGCLDNYLSGRGFESLYQHYYMEHIDAIDVIANAEQGDKRSVEFVDMFLELTSICFANIFTAWDPDRVVLGGGLSNFELLYDELPKRIPKYMLTESISLPSIEKAKFGDASGVRGAAFLNF